MKPYYEEQPEHHPNEPQAPSQKESSPEVINLEASQAPKRSSRLADDQSAADQYTRDQAKPDLLSPTDPENMQHQRRIEEQVQSSRPVVEIPPFRPNPNDYIWTVFFAKSSQNLETVITFLTEKETRDRRLSAELRAKGIITTPGEPFEASRKKEIEGLLAQGVFKVISGDSPELVGQRIFGSRLVNEVKGTATATPYEKSRCVIQAYNNKGKSTVLTQSPTI